jgi:hypothetical protein
MDILMFFLYLSFSIQNKIIQNGVYAFLADDLYLSYYKRRIIPSKIFKRNTFFHINKISGYSNDTLYHIVEAETKIKIKLCYSQDKELILNNKYHDLHLWFLRKIGHNDDYDDYIIKNNNNNCYIKIDRLKILCDTIRDDEATIFKLIKIYDEVNEDIKDINMEILNNEPIDILIKYIDVRDPDLKREGIHQIEKDYDNEELRYSIRSIINNIPWIRKIFILMPNEKVRFLKDYNSIKDKIIYIKDKDLLGYDSSNSHAFQYRYWKLKNFNITENIIIMDDDCFIGNKLQKSDFFYVENGKVLPLIVTSNFLQLDKKLISDNYKFYEREVKLNNEEQNDIVWQYCVYNTYSFIFDLFNISYNKYIFLPKHNHNAIPVNLKEINEIYDIIYKSKFKYPTLDCSYRHIKGIQFQIFIISYMFLKYNKKVNIILSNFIQLNN